LKGRVVSTCPTHYQKGNKNARKEGGNLLHKPTGKKAIYGKLRAEYKDKGLTISLPDRPAHGVSYKMSQSKRKRLAMGN